MSTPSLHVGDKVVVQRQQLQPLLDGLRAAGYQIIGPTQYDGAIVYDEVESVDDLPAGWADEQSGGTYRLKKRDDKALFGYTAAPQAWKKFLNPPVRTVWRAKRDGDSFTMLEEAEQPPKYAFLGVRSCELQAIAIQDKVYTKGPFGDPVYQSRRDQSFIIAVNCGQAGGTCFCVSMNTGPKAESGFDLAMTEVVRANRHVFVIEVGTERGANLLAAVPHEAANDKDKATAQRIVDETAKRMGRTLDTYDLKNFLYARYEHPRWDDVAHRCLACANCTMVCPTCFCSTVEDVTDLTGNEAQRVQRWDSCFTKDFSYIHGGSVRSSQKARYRQWMTHKLATWIDQFGTSGCVGCGRCITWCPVGIDITEEVRAMHEGEPAHPMTISTLNAV